VREGLLYAGTETGLYISFDDGATWESCQLNLPIAPIHDLLVKDGDLIAATHGRSFWILDDVSPLRQFEEGMTKPAVHLFQPRSTHRIAPALFEGLFESGPGKNYSIAFGTLATYTDTKTIENAIRRSFIDAGANPPKAVIVTYHLKKKPKDKISLAFLDAKGSLIREFFSKPEGEKDDATQNLVYDKPEPTPEEKNELKIPANPGMNRFLWDMRYPDSTKVEGEDISAALVKGPMVAPGKYQVQLKVGKETLTQTFEITRDPRVSTAQADLEAQRDILLQIRDKMSETNHTINQIRYLRQQADEWTKRFEGHPQHDKIKDAATKLKDKLKEIEEPLIVPGLKSYHQTLNYGVRLAGKLAALVPVVASADFAPTKQVQEVFTLLSKQIDAQIKALNKVMETDVDRFNDLIWKAEIAPLVLKPKKQTQQ
jgi:hypothetical protein